MHARRAMEAQALHAAILIRILLIILILTVQTPTGLGVSSWKLIWQSCLNKKWKSSQKSNTHSFQEFVRLQTFNRSGFQQIQLDMQYLRTTLKDTTDSEDEAALEFLLDEVIVAAAERCLDPSPLEPAILDRLVQLKLAR
uniref:Vacuolar protein sorting-associated protein 51 homolog n=1 Tax=Lactuca sativa TaxID=4236 RepID=A0A9R1WPB4_LACSA|nr:hypothetical protein LSAT_V11C100015370 [Lactuca sativa]